MTEPDNKLQAYFDDAFQRHEVDYKASVWARQASKWWLDLFRNIIVVSGVYYLAQKADSTVLKIFSYAYFGALIWFVSSYFNTWSFRFFPYIKNPRLNFWANGAIWIVLYGAITLVCYVGLAAVFKSLSVLQSR